MNCNIEFTKAGMMTTIQDLGRKGLAYYAVPRSGAMDSLSATLANILVGNEETNPVIEFTITGGTFKLTGPAMIAFTGADLEWEMDGKKIELNQSIEIRGIHYFKSSFAKSGVRSYLAIAGNWELDPILGSFSTCLSANIGPFEGKTIGAKQSIVIENPTSPRGTIKSSPALNLTAIDHIKLDLGPEWSILTETSKESLLSQFYTIGSQSNRMGARLESKDPLTAGSYDINSSAVFPGVIQLPPSGQPIVVLQDGQTTGGYARIAIIPKSELSRFNQIRFGHKIRFTI